MGKFDSGNGMHDSGSDEKSDCGAGMYPYHSGNGSGSGSGSGSDDYYHMGNGMHDSGSDEKFDSGSKPAGDNLEPCANVKCGAGTIQRGDQCVGVSATCAGMWTGVDRDDVVYKRGAPCQCNGLCRRYHNCCPDFMPFWEQKWPGFCASKKFPNHYEATWHCQCNDKCRHYGNCCSDAPHPPASE